MNEDKIIQEILGLKDDIRILKETAVTKEELRELKELMEEAVTITKKIREDHIFALEWLKRLQDKVDVQEQEIRRQQDEIKQIKLQLKMA